MGYGTVTVSGITVSPWRSTGFEPSPIRKGYAFEGGGVERGALPRVFLPTAGGAIGIDRARRFKSTKQAHAAVGMPLTKTRMPPSYSSVSG
jgi:hypothetical protein